MNDEDDKKSLIKRAVELALGLDPVALAAYVEAKRAANPSLSPRSLAEKLVSAYASKAGAEGFVTGLPSTPFAAIPAGTADMVYVLRCYAGLVATIGYLANPKYFEDPDWMNDVYVMVVGRTLVTRALRDAGVAFGKQYTKLLIRKHLSKAVLEALKRALVKWFAKKVTQRTIITKTVPVVGGVIGGVWNFAEIKVIGNKAIVYHFDEP